MQSAPTYVINNNPLVDNVQIIHQPQMLVDEFPERPGQPECSYFLRTGDCKYKSNCKYHHPKNRIPKSPPCTLSDKGLPLRPVSSDFQLCFWMIYLLENDNLNCHRILSYRVKTKTAVYCKTNLCSYKGDGYWQCVPQWLFICFVASKIFFADGVNERLLFLFISFWLLVIRIWTLFDHIKLLSFLFCDL